MYVDEKLVLRKIESIRRYVNELKTMVNFNDFSDFKRDVVSKRFVERNLQLAIDLMMDICKHIVSNLYGYVPDSYSECIDMLAKGGKITPERVELYKNMIRYRNLLVHIYHEVDDTITYGIYKRHLDDFELFIEDIEDIISMLKD